MNIFSDMIDWSEKPYSADMPIGGWIAFIGMLVVLTVLWHQVIRFIIE